MKVSKVGSSKTVESSRKKKTASVKSGEFAERLKETAGAANAVGGVEPSAPGGVDGILSVQEVPDATDERSRGLARQYGESLLDSLEDLRRDLLVGAIPKEKLAGLAQRLRARRQKSDDPKLNAIIDEIELRAEVEIAKFTRAG